MFHHVVLFKWAEGTGPEQTTALCESLSRLPDLIPELRRYRYGSNAGPVDRNWDFAVVADFDDEAGWRAYVDHPDHREVIDNHIRPLLGERAAVQFTFER